MPGGINPPLVQWSKWPNPNYINPTTKPKHILFAACFFGPLSLLVLSARLWVRIRIQRNAGWDDWLMLASWV
ncbi:hypothetical protein BKA66DRAFT_423792 [Pyrenochaeta sp. MPI-SDFR-AT-0127]|nr:hypothetical protein BKA66DRAFT_423792 [Pyrenochaeta sp. MPI-SDFR-AT-0127]